MPALPLLSILMPTKDRSECAKHAISSLLAFSRDDFELIVHDNSSNDSLSKWVAALTLDKRLRYYRAPNPLSINENFACSLQRSRGQYVGAMGDDDGLSPCVLELCDWLLDNRADALTPKYPASYRWPGVRSGTDGEPTMGTLKIGKFSGRVELADAEVGLRECVRNGAVRLTGLPTLYHGLVSRRSLERVLQQTGYYTPGISPDMAAAIALASHVDRFATIDYPLYVPGASVNSGAGRGVRKAHHGDLRSEAYLDKRLIDRWPSGIPAYFSGPTMWASAAIQALQATGREDVLQGFNYAATHAACLVFVPTHRKATWASLIESRWSPSLSGKAASLLTCGTRVIENIMRRGHQLSLNRLSRSHSYRMAHFDNIADAMKALVDQPMPLHLPQLLPIDGFGRLAA